MTETLVAKRLDAEDAHFGPVHGNWQGRVQVILLVLAGAVLLAVIEHQFMLVVPLVWYYLLDGVIESAIILALVFTYLRWQRQARRAEHGLMHLQESENLRDDLTAMLVHDLKNPLIASAMALQAVLRRQTPQSCLSPQELEYLEMAREAQARLGSMIEDLLDIARAEGGELQLEFEQLDLCELTQLAINEAAPAAGKAKLELGSECEGPLPMTGDRRKLRRVLDNLLTNAIKFTPEGRVFVLVGSEGEQVRLQVSDTGPGIPPEMHERVFDKYGQITAGQRMSVGLGLAFCKLVVEAHGGSISLDSQPGRGSTFTVILPRREDEPGASGE